MVFIKGTSSCEEKEGRLTVSRNTTMQRLSVIVLWSSLSFVASERTQMMNFEEYAKRFGKIYENEEEMKMRRAVFEENAQIIADHPAESTYVRGFNQFTDRTNEEMNDVKGLDKHLLHLQKRRWEHVPLESVVEMDYPPSKEYSSILTPVKNQGKCGSCWTFASTETIESHWALKTGMLMELSEQFILDCTPNPEECGGTGGCGGGTAELAYARLKELGGIPTEWEYPYVSILGNASTCHGIPLAKESPHEGVPSAAANVSGFWHTRENSYDDLMMALVTRGPLAVSVDAGGWHDYESGIFDGGNLTNPNLDHLVQLVGYGSENGVDYWKLRNSVRLSPSDFFVRSRSISRKSYLSRKKTVDTVMGRGWFYPHQTIRSEAWRDRTLRYGFDSVRRKRMQGWTE